MRTLYENAIEAIQIGVEDYQANDPRRASSAVRNFYSGTLLLAKEALRRQAPDADQEIMLAARLKPKPNGRGGVDMVPDGRNTIDFSNIGPRLDDFGIEVDMQALRNLNRIRTDIEHAANPHAEDAVRDAIASAFPVIAQLFDAMEEQPADELGTETWGAMLSVREMFEREKRQCDGTFANIDWGTGTILGAMERTCPDCGSPLVEASVAAGQNFQWATVRCRRCGSGPSIEQFVVHLVEEHYAADSYRAAMGEVATPVHDCPDCSVHAYLTTEDHHGCVWCEFELGECEVCREPLTPDNVDGDDNKLCSYHGYVMSKDD